MPISEFLLLELDEEMKKTRTTLERVPADKKEFAPHAKSMPLGKLAPHVAQLAGFGLTILTTPELDFSKGSITPVPFESAAQLVRAFDEGAAKVRVALQATPDEAWKEHWNGDGISFAWCCHWMSDSPEIVRAHGLRDRHSRGRLGGVPIIHQAWEAAAAAFAARGGIEPALQKELRRRERVRDRSPAYGCRGTPRDHSPRSKS